MEFTRRTAIILLAIGSILMVGLTWGSEYHSCVRTNGVTDQINDKLTEFGENADFEKLSCLQPLPDTRTPEVMTHDN